MLDTYTHVINEWRGRGGLDIESEIRQVRKRVSPRPEEERLGESRVAGDR
ncbi:MAG: hypothetical protein M3P50_10290 [Actinomycetota bacterium]|nr:hypothetical protein [Actinomycetota bacterium]